MKAIMRNALLIILTTIFLPSAFAGEVTTSGSTAATTKTVPANAAHSTIPESVDAKNDIIIYQLADGRYSIRSPGCSGRKKQPSPAKLLMD